MSVSTSISIAMLDILVQLPIMRRSPQGHPDTLHHSPSSFSSLLRFIEERNSPMAGGAAQFPQYSDTVQAKPIEINAAINQEFVATQRERSPIRRCNYDTEQQGSVFDAAMHNSNSQDESQHFQQRGALPQDVTISQAVPLQNQQQIGLGGINQEGIIGFPPGLTPQVAYGALNFGLIRILVSGFYQEILSQIGLNISL